MANYESVLKFIKQIWSSDYFPAAFLLCMSWSFLIFILTRATFFILWCIFIELNNMVLLCLLQYFLYHYTFFYIIVVKIIGDRCIFGYYCCSKDLLLITFTRPSLRKMCPYSEFFWSMFSCITTEYGKIQTRKAPNTDTFHSVLITTITISTLSIAANTDNIDSNNITKINTKNDSKMKN